MRYLLAPLLLLSSPALAKPESVASRTEAVGSFDRIRVEGPFEVRVTIGSPRAMITGDPALEFTALDAVDGHVARARDVRLGQPRQRDVHLHLGALGPAEVRAVLAADFERFAVTLDLQPVELVGRAFGANRKAGADANVDIVRTAQVDLVEVGDLVGPRRARARRRDARSLLVAVPAERTGGERNDQPERKIVHRILLCVVQAIHSIGGAAKQNRGRRM